MSSSAQSLTSAQVKELDRLASERFGIALDWLMEAAGWQAARACEGRTAVLCGIGNNAGDGLTAARHLHRWGRLASVACIERSRLRGDARRELEALAKLGVEVGEQPSFTGADVVLDAVFGTGLNRAPAGRFAEWIEAINAAGLRVVAVDVPSGLDSDTGVAYAPCVRADATITFTLPKAGLLTKDGPRVSGAITVADIGIPNEALAAIGIEAPA
ncbi:MAG TPA: NAD(P)H-hydrate epimerase [Candidatus Dormibacteraeota bacterium]|nr:NAD(P)H-hydrate epimerase [Candidatus Dormibacteraeota bacterium]